MKKRIKKIYSIIVTTLIVLVAILAVALVGVRLFGLTPYAVISGSMEPEYSVGSVIYIQKVSADSLEVGDTITYERGGATVTHRIVEKTHDLETGLAFKTKGDANTTVDDGFVRPSQIMGKALFSLPFLGYIAYAVQTPTGMFAAIGFVIVLIILSFMGDIFFAEQNDKKEDENEEEKKEIENLG